MRLREHLSVTDDRLRVAAQAKVLVGRRQRNRFDSIELACNCGAHKDGLCVCVYPAISPVTLAHGVSARPLCPWKARTHIMATTGRSSSAATPGKCLVFDGGVLHGENFSNFEIEPPAFHLWRPTEKSLWRRFSMLSKYFNGLLGNE